MEEGSDSEVDLNEVRETLRMELKQKQDRLQSISELHESRKRELNDVNSKLLKRYETNKRKHDDMSAKIQQVKRNINSLHGTLSSMDGAYTRKFEDLNAKHKNTMQGLEVRRTEMMHRDGQLDEILNSKRVEIKELELEGKQLDRDIKEKNTPGQTSPDEGSPRVQSNQEVEQPNSSVLPTNTAQGDSPPSSENEDSLF